MFRRYPYRGWLLLSIVFWVIAAYFHYSHIRLLKPAQMVQTISDDLQKREHAVNDLKIDKNIIKKIFSDSLNNDDVTRLQKLPFYIYAYDKDTLVYWNSNNAIADFSKVTDEHTVVLKSTGGIFGVSSIRLPQKDSTKRMYAIIPMLITYPVENDHLRSHFISADYIPANSKISIGDSVEQNGYPVKSIYGKTLFKIQFHTSDILNKGPDTLNLWLIILAAFTTLSWLQLLIINLSKERSPLYGLSATLIVIAILLICRYCLGLPFGIDNLAIFSPRLYASNPYLSSLGNLLINTVALLWIIVFIIRHTPYRTAFSEPSSTFSKWLISVLLCILLVGYALGYVWIVRGLVLDSNIPLDVSHFFTITIYTVLGLFSIAIITAVSCLVFYLINTWLNNCLSTRFLKYILIGIIGTLYLLIFYAYINQYQDFYYVLVAWVILFIWLLDLKYLKLTSDLFAPHMIFWAIFICAFCTFILQYFNHIKESDARRSFAEHRITERDYVTEFAFNNIGQNIEKDTIITSFIQKPTTAGRKTLNEHIEAAYLNGQLNKYEARVYIFDATHRPMFNRDTTSYLALVTKLMEYKPSDGSQLFYKQNNINQLSYISSIDIAVDSINKKIGYLFITLDQKHEFGQTVYPELLQPLSLKPNPNEKEYAYAIYSNGKLVSHTNDYAFPVYLKNKLPQNQKYAYYNKSDASELWYNNGDNITVIAVHFHDALIENITLFSYLFVIEILISVFVIGYQFYLSYFLREPVPAGFSSLTLRRRIHLFMLATAFFSFIVLGLVTIIFFHDRYNNSNKEKLQSAMGTIEESIDIYLKNLNQNMNENEFIAVCHASKFKDFISNLAAEEKIDINIFDVNGVMQVTSQEDIYDKGLLARVIRPDAYYNINKQGRSLLIQNEQIGSLSYLSCYVPLHDDYGTTYGYINVPFFASQTELNIQISNIVVSLINIYAFIFLLSSLLTGLITRWITRTLNIVIRQFERLNLRRNERIKWPYDDEIGKLVEEYNKMVNKLEENAALLAQSERESAWREMARQVAHEIKNPLTPMKLNIQYLQQALKNDQPNVQELAARVSDSLIEQIDNLSYIASEFSNFAKMPEAKPEQIDLDNLLDTAVELYQNIPDIKVSITKHPEPLYVYADKSQLLRVLNNLLENAKQAIPANKQGHIEVALIKKHDYAWITVTDNGSGIEQDKQGRIFQPYFTTKTSGTGLGLAMTKKIIEFWKGVIWFDTEVDKGTTFYIQLPLFKEKE